MANKGMVITERKNNINILKSRASALLFLKKLSFGADLTNFLKVI